MVNGNGLLRIFWPSDAPRNKSPGTIVGWRNSELDIFVVSVLHEVEVLFLQMLYSSLSDMSVATQCRECSACWITISQQPASCWTIVPNMWKVIYECTWYNEPTHTT